MNNTILRLCMLLCCLVGTAIAEPGGLAGVWTLTIETPRGVQHPVLTITREGDTYAGTYEGRVGKLPVPAIASDGERFSFPLTVDMPMGRMQLEYAGTIEGDTMRGVARNPRGEVPFTGVRAPGQGAPGR